MMLDKKYISYPFNWDIENIKDVLNKYSDAIKEIYLPLPWEKPWTPRISRYEKNIPLNDIYNICRNASVELNILLNAAIREPIFYTQSWFELLKKAIWEVVDTWITDITIWDLPLAIKVKNAFPKLKIHISATAAINSIPKFNIWRNLLEVHEVCIDTSKNKDLDFIKQIRKSWVKIKLLVNENCFSDCPMRSIHQNMISLKIEAEDGFSYKSVCEEIKNTSPWYIYQSWYITPYILYKHYDGLLDTVKLVWRSKESRDNLLTLENYLNRESRAYFLRENKNTLIEPDWVFDQVSTCNKECDDCNFCKTQYQLTT